MDNNESKPQQTGGLKLMTVFIAVLALHVLVIGGFTVYHLMGSSGGDADTAMDKTHKPKADGTALADTSTLDTSAPDKATDATASTDGSAAPATTGTATTASSTGPATTGTSTAAIDAAATPVSTGTVSPVSTPVATTPAAQVENVPAAPAAENGPGNSPLLVSADDMAQTSTIPAALIPPPDATPAPMATPASNSPAPATTVVAQTPAPSVVPSPAPAPGKVQTPTLAPALVSTGAKSVPTMSVTTVASAPALTPANPPKFAPDTVGDSNEVKRPVAARAEHLAASVHEARREIYTVKITDSYQKIAHAHHITVAELKEANHIKGNTLHTGQKLVIPAAKTEVAKGEKMHDSSTGKTASTATGETRAHHKYYTVAKGDTLRRIAKKFNITSLALEKANDLSGTRVTVGEKLRIPTHEVRSVETASDVVSARPLAPAPVPAPVERSQVETQPAPVVQPEPTPVATPAPVPQPTPTPASNPELANLTF